MCAWTVIETLLGSLCHVHCEITNNTDIIFLKALCGLHPGVLFGGNISLYFKLGYTDNNPESS